MASLAPVSTLPRFIAIKAGAVDNGPYLTLQQTSDGSLLFKATAKERLATFEVLYNVDDSSGSFILRSQNSHFLQCDSSGRVWANAADAPQAGDNTGRFKIGSSPVDSSYLAFQSADGRYLKTQTTPNTYVATDATDGLYTEVFVEDASDYAINMPEEATFKAADIGKFMVMSNFGGHNWLQFNGNGSSTATDWNEMQPTIDAYFNIKNFLSGSYWYNSVQWIWAEVSSPGTRSDCLFLPIKLSDTMVAFQSRSDSGICKRLTSGKSESCLDAQGSSINDVSTHLIVADATLSQQVNEVKYLLNLGVISNAQPIVVGRGSETNNSSETIDMTVGITITQSVEETTSWSTGVSFNESVAVSIQAGVPEVAEVTDTITVGSEQTFSTNWGTTTTTTLEFDTEYTVNGVPPGATATVTLVCTTATITVPFTYNSKKTNLEGVDGAVTQEIDGYYTGVSAYGTNADITNGNGAAYTVLASLKRG